MAIAGGFTVWAGMSASSGAATIRLPGLGQVRRRWQGLSRALRLRLAIGGVAGLLVTLFTGFVPALLLVPVLVTLLPELLGNSPNPELQLLEALDRWVRAVAASVGTGKSVTDALRATRSQAPAVLAGPVRSLVARLDNRWPLRDALHEMADELDQADADSVLTALILVGERGGVGASATLQALSAVLQERLHAMREIDSERAKPQIVVRQVTVITLTALGGALLFAPGYFAAFLSVPGQVLLAVLGLAYLGSLWALRRLAAPRRRDRILVRSVAAGKPREPRYA